MQQLQRLQEKEKRQAEGASRVIWTQLLIQTETEGTETSKAQQPESCASRVEKAAVDETKTRGANVSVAL